MRSIFATNKKIKRDVFVYLLFILFSIYTLVLMTNSLFLPENFDNDATYIRFLIHVQCDKDVGAFDGFCNTALIYSGLGADAVFPEWLVILVANTVYWIAAIKVLKKSALHRQNFFKILVSLSWIFCSALFLSRYSKDLLAIVPIFFICFVRMKTYLQKIAVLLVVFAYMIYIRQYWALILYFYFAFHYLFFQVNKSISFKLIVMAVISFLPFWISSILGHQYLTDWRIISNLVSSDPDRAKSALDNLLANTSVLTDYVNAFYGWFYLNIPIQILFSDVIYYKAFALFQFGSVVTLLATIYAEFKFHHERSITADPFYSRCLSFVLAYSLTQAIFEPDVGSFLRHEIILAVPLIYILYPKRANLEQSKHNIVKTKLAI